MIRLVVDSSADFLAEELKEKNIELVPLNIYLAGETYQDGVTLERNQFYEILTGQ
jgi:fatty acid-binding protein DegV